MKGFEPYPILESRIRTGVYPAGTWLPTERDLSEEFGVHRNVVRRAIARLGDAGLVERRPGHRPVVRRPEGAQADPRTIALVMGNEPMFHAFQPIMRGCEREASEHGYRLIYMDTFAIEPEATRRREADALHSLLCNPVAGAVIWSLKPGATSEIVRELQEAGTPVVAIDRPLTDCPTDFVGVDNVRGATEMVEHLLGAGRRRIRHLTLGGEGAPIWDRLEGYRRAMRAAGFAEVPEPLTVTAEELEGPRLDEVVAEMLNGAEPPDAVFAVNDIVAWRLVHALRRAGARVPEDIAVAGFDDIEAPTLHHPFLTTIRQPFEDMGRHAAALLVRRIENPREPLRHVLLGTSLVVRASTAA